MRDTIKSLVLALLSLAAAAPAQPAPSLAFTHVTVIDAGGAAPRHDATVVIEGDHITALGETGHVAIPKDARVIDASGKYLIPGLWDMHVHLGVTGMDYTPFFPLYIANGVTGVRDMGGILHQAQFDVWRQEIGRGELHGPRLAVGTLVDGAKPVRPWISVAAANAATARMAVGSIKRSGADFVKVYSLLSRDAYFALADEAKAQKIPFAGHVPHSLTAAEASDAGQKSMEHLFGVTLSAATDEVQLRARLQRRMQALTARPFTPDDELQTYLEVETEALESRSAGKSARLFARFVKNGTWQCPTLTLFAATASRSPRGQEVDVRLEYVPASQRQLWKPQEERNADELARERRSLRHRLELVNAMHEAGVGILAGTDAPSPPGCLPGFSLHDELELLVQAGLTPLQALEAATLNAARYLGRERELGTVEAGKLADLVLLGANPLEDIRNTRTIDSVIVAGRLIDKVQRVSMLAAVANWARER